MYPTTKQISFPGFDDYKISAEFADEAVTSDGGILLLREIDRKLGLSKQLAKNITERRDPTRIVHSLQSMLQQRIFGLSLGYEDLNDHDNLRHDPAFQTSAERDESLASSPTLCRLENAVTRQDIIQMCKAIVEQFINSYSLPPQELILDFDPTDNEVHGHQEGSHYHGYYQHFCFLPLKVYCGHRLLVSYLRPSNIDSAKHAWAILSLLVKRFRQVWPHVKIIFRGDGAFCRDKIMRWCEKNNVGYIIAIGKNKRLIDKAKGLIVRAEQDFENTEQKQRLFDQIYYAAKSWNIERKVVVKAEHNEKGPNPRFIVTNLDGLPQYLYDTGYCKRGDMENRIKELKLDCSSNRNSCHRYLANQFRLLLSASAYILIEGLRRIALSKTHLAKAQCSTIRLSLLKIAAMVIRKSNQVRFILSAHFPNKDIFNHASIAIQSG